jgi:hypothetical protein
MEACSKIFIEPISYSASFASFLDIYLDILLVLPVVNPCTMVDACIQQNLRNAYRAANQQYRSRSRH